MRHTWNHYSDAVSDRRRSLKEYIQYSRRARSYAAEAGPDKPVFYIDESLRWQCIARLFLVSRFTNMVRRLDTTHLRELRRIQAYNRWIWSHFEVTNGSAVFHHGGILLQMPREFPNAAAVAVNDLREIFLENRYSNLLPQGALVRDGDVVIDCGASIGAFAVLAAKQADNVRVLAFEPEPVTYDCLLQNVRLNGLEAQIDCFSFGLARKHSLCKLLHCADCFTMHRIDETIASVDNSCSAGASVGTVTCVPIDEIVKERSLDRCDLIKMDIEGAEKGALLGAAETLRRFRPKLTIAAYHKPGDPFVLSTTIREICPEYNVFVSRDLHLYAFA